MAIGTTSDLDKKLAEMFKEGSVKSESKMDPEHFWKSMQIIAMNNSRLVNYTKLNKQNPESNE